MATSASKSRIGRKSQQVLDDDKTKGNGEHEQRLDEVDPNAPVPVTKKGFKTKAIVVPQLRLETFDLALVGDTPYISGRLSHANAGKIRDKQTQVPKSGTPAKDPIQDYLDSMYFLETGQVGVKAIAFKRAAVDVCTLVGGVTMKAARGAFHISENFGGTLRPAELVPIHGVPTMREDKVAIGISGTDLRYRAEFKEWWVRLTIRHNPAFLSAAQIVNLFNHAGFSIGVGEWRAERDGKAGLFHVALGGDMPDADLPIMTIDQLEVEGRRPNM